MIFSFSLLNHHFRFLISHRHIKNIDVYGYTNRTKDGFYIPFIDYDNLDLEWIIPEVQRLQDDFSLGNFYILESTKGHYHAVCFDKLSFQKFIQLLEMSSVDRNYLNIGRKWGIKLWTLRLTPKEEFNIKVVKTLERKGDYIQSFAHQKLFSKIFKCDVLSTDNDGIEELIFARYII